MANEIITKQETIERLIKEAKEQGRQEREQEIISEIKTRLNKLHFELSADLIPINTRMNVAGAILELESLKSQIQNYSQQKQNLTTEDYSLKGNNNISQVGSECGALTNGEMSAHQPQNRTKDKTADLCKDEKKK